MILTKTNTQAKYQNGISYHLLLCFLAAISVNKSPYSYNKTNCCIINHEGFYFETEFLESLRIVGVKARAIFELLKLKIGKIVTVFVAFFFIRFILLSSLCY